MRGTINQNCLEGYLHMGCLLNGLLPISVYLIEIRSVCLINNVEWLHLSSFPCHQPALVRLMKTHNGRKLSKRFYSVTRKDIKYLHVIFHHGHKFNFCMSPVHHTYNIIFSLISKQ